LLNILVVYTFIYFYGTRFRYVPILGIGYRSFVYVGLGGLLYIGLLDVGLLRVGLLAIAFWISIWLLWWMGCGSSHPCLLLP
jgi:hypothetical protein